MLEMEGLETPNKLMHPDIKHQLFLTSQKKDITRHCLPPNDTMSFIKQFCKKVYIKPECNQASRSNYQFTGNTEDRRTS